MNKFILKKKKKKRICLQCRRPKFNPWVGKIPWRRAWQPTPVLLPGQSHGQSGLVGYSPQGCTKSDTTEVTKQQQQQQQQPSCPGMFLCRLHSSQRQAPPFRHTRARPRGKVIGRGRSLDSELSAVFKHGCRGKIFAPSSTLSIYLLQ